MADRKSDFALPTLDELFSTQEERDDAKLEKIRDIPLELIDDFPDHPFHVRDDEDMVQLVESVKTNGVLTPAVLRQKEDGRYEIVSGHRRKRACELAGLTTLRSEIKDLTRDYNVIPSFSYDTQAKAKSNVKELKYSDGKYSLTLTDSNKILSDYTFKKTGDVSVSISGNSITLTSSKAIPDALVFSATKKMPNVTTTLVACGSSSKQDVVTGVQSDTETMTAYFAVKTSAGSLKIVKTSDDGKVEGIKFKVTGADNYSKTVTTNSKGEFQIDDLKVGTYTVTEITEERYEDQKAQTVKVESGKVATVKFSNVLKRGDLQVVKSSELAC